MKPLGPIRPEPPPPGEFRRIVIALLILLISVAMGLYWLRDAGFIGDTLFGAIMTFFIAVAAGILLSLDMERQAHARGTRRGEEIPPPSDFHTVWPPKARPKDTARGTSGLSDTSKGPRA